MSQTPRTPTDEGPREQLREKVLDGCPRLKGDDTFHFTCRPGISCFNRCCADVNIFLSPLDVLRIKNRLGLTSGEFLDKYTLMPVQKDMRTPVLILRMNDDEKKTCPFVSETGCSIYSDRPWPCRMYPLGLAAPDDENDDEAFFFLLEEDVCNGHDSDRKWTVAEWIADQEIDDYNEIGDLYKEIALHPRILRGKPLDPKQVDMFFTACYDLDKFKRFLFETTFFEKFDVEPETIEQLKTDDEALLKFAFRWIRFSLFREPSLKVKEEIVQAKKREFS